MADSADWNFGSGDFTIDFWVRRNGDQNNYNGLVSATALVLTGWVLCFVAGADANKIEFASNATGSWTIHVVSNTTIADTTQTHVALVRYGNIITLYFAGSSVGSFDCTGLSFNSSGSGLNIGRLVTDVDNYYFNGHQDELRISKGIARWMANFTPPTSEYGDFPFKSFYPNILVQ